MNKKYLLVGVVLVILAFLLVATPIPFDEVIAGITGLFYLIKGIK